MVEDPDTLGSLLGRLARSTVKLDLPTSQEYGGGAMKHVIASRLLVAFTCLALLIVGPLPDAAGKGTKVHCKGTKVPVTVGKRTTCRPLAQAIPKPKAITPMLAHLQEALTFDVSKAGGRKAKRFRSPQSGFGAAGKRAQKKLLKVLPKALALIEGARGRGAGSSGLDPGLATASACAARGPVDPVGNISGVGVGVAGDNGGQIALSIGGLTYVTRFAECGSHFLYVAGCPSAAGVANAKMSQSSEITQEVREGEKVVSRSTTSIDTKVQVRGKVASDAKLDYIDVDVSEETFIVASGGVVLRGTAERSVRVNMRNGKYDPAGASVRLTGNAKADSGESSFASAVNEAIEEFRAAESGGSFLHTDGWSTFNRQRGPYCAEPVFSPDSNTLKLSKGKTGKLSIYAKGEDGGRATGAKWTLLSPENADFSPTSSQDAAPNISYTVTKAPKEGQVKVTVKFTSTAGVGEKTWTQPIGGGIQHISGTFSGHWEGPSYTGGPNYHYDFSGKASFDRRPSDTYPARFDLVSGSISENFSGETDPESEDRPACQVNGHADRTLPPSEENYFELAGSGSSHSDPPFAYTVWLIEVTGEGEFTYSECKYEFDEGTESGTGLFYGEVFLGYSEDEFTFAGTQGVPEGKGEITWSFTGTP
jgi:hypothetical protein